MSRSQQAIGWFNVTAAHYGLFFFPNGYLTLCIYFKLSCNLQAFSIQFQILFWQHLLAFDVYEYHQKHTSRNLRTCIPYAHIDFLSIDRENSSEISAKLKVRLLTENKTIFALITGKYILEHSGFCQHYFLGRLHKCLNLMMIRSIFNSTSPTGILPKHRAFVWSSHAISCLNPMNNKNR